MAMLRGLALPVLLALAMLFLTQAVAQAREGQLAFIRGDQVWLADSHGHAQRMLARLHDLDWYPPALSSDGRLVAAAAGSDPRTGLGRVFFLPTGGGDVRLAPMPGIHSACCPALSPDGSLLAMVAATRVRTDDTGQDVWADMSVAVLDMRTGSSRILISQPDSLLHAGYGFANPSFSPDGTLLAFQESGSDVSGGFQVLDLATGRLVFSYPLRGDDFRPYWRPGISPGNDAVLCHSPGLEPGQPSRILLVSMRTGEARELTTGANPSYTDDFQAIVFERWRDQGETRVADIWRLDLRTGARPELIIRNGRAPSGE